jgi:hypothetical protein
MTTMVRKQVYIEPRQDKLLKQWAEETGRSEAEIFRQVLDRQAAVAGPMDLHRVARGVY